MYQKSANKSRYIVRYSLNVQHIYMYKIEKKILLREIQNLNRKRERDPSHGRGTERAGKSLYPSLYEAFLRLKGNCRI